jgi:hypothetical protein
MSSTLRLFLNDQRISTAVPLKSGAILQVYPTKLQFSDEPAWRQHWENELKPKITVLSGDEGFFARWGYFGKSAIDAVFQKPATVSVAQKPATESVAQKPATSLNDWAIKNADYFSFTLPAGEYYIGDLCYVLSDDIYDKIFGGTGYKSGIYEEKGTGRTFLVTRTWGDGNYRGSDGKDFIIDSSSLGICSASLMAKNDGGGHTYTFSTPVKCKFTGGRCSFFWDHYKVLDVNINYGDEEY